MADPSFNAKARTIASLTAKATVDLMQNRGLGLNVNEVRSVLEAVDSDASEFYCKGCGHPLSSDELKGSHCGVCGSRQATDAPVFRCGNPRCMAPVSIKQESCLRCGSREAVKANGKPLVTIRNPVQYTCKDCLAPVNLEQPSCGCGGREAYRTIER